MSNDQKPVKDSSARQPLPPVDRKSCESGWIPQGAVTESRRPETSVQESLNMDFDTIGAATLRKGQTLLGNQMANSAILGLYYFLDNMTGTNTQLVAVNGTTVFYLAGNTWTAVRSGMTAGSKARFTTMLNFLFMVNGTEPTAIWDGSTGDGFVTTGNASGAPSGQFIETYQGRMWIAGNTTYPDRVYFSTVPSAAVTPVIAWSTDPVTGTQWIDVATQDGDEITGLIRYRSQLIIFKTNHLYRLYNIGQVDADPYYAVGATSAESIVETKAGIFFFHSSGFYQFNVYGIVQEISGPIRIDVIQNIPESSWASVVGWVEPDGDHVCWSIGTVTIRGITYTNMVVRYTISTMVWTHRTYPTQITASMRRQPFYADTLKQYALTGDTAGNVLQMNTGLTDNGVGIDYSIIHRWETLDGLLSTRKTVMVANFSHYGGAGAIVAFQTEDQDPDDLNNWTRQIGQLSTINTGFNSMDIKSRKFRFRVFGTSTGVPFFYNGYEIIDALAEFIQFSEQ